MPRYDLATLARRQRPGSRKKSITLRPVVAPAMLASDLYRSVYAPIIAVWQEHSTRIADEYARTLAEMTQDSPADVQGAVDAAANSATSLYLTLTPSLRNWVLKVERSIRQRFTRQIYSATSVDLSTILGPSDAQATLDTYLRWNTDLIADVSAQTKQRIANSVFSGLTERKPAREVAKEISEAIGMARKRSLGIASDQLSKLSGSLADERRRQAGMTEWEWNHGGKKHYRPEHLARHGFLYTDDSKNVGKRVEGKVVRSPPQRGDLPSQKPYCSCVSRAILVFEFDE